MPDDGLFEPVDWTRREEQLLAPYAMRTAFSRGRRYPEPAHLFRSLYQRDRDRVIHSTAFRRLMHKTQVLVIQTNDHHRTRLTHTLEVAQIARTIARRLGLNEDLVEAIALSHDLGHPPFGHAGEKALDECLTDDDGFEHNLQALRLVEDLEYPYPTFPGLNLSWEVREAMAWHTSRKSRPEVIELRSAGQPLLEARVADAADSLAYVCHDVDDALGAELITFDDLLEVALWRITLDGVQQRHGTMPEAQLRPTMVRALIDTLVTDLIEHSLLRIREEHIEQVADVRECATILIEPGSATKERKEELSSFLRHRVYGHVRVVRMAHKGERIVKALFEAFTRSPELLPERYRQRLHGADTRRVVGDYIAGMTDRYAQDEYLRLFHPYTPV
jgi:dGTPase